MVCPIASCQSISDMATIKVNVSLLELISQLSAERPTRLVSISRSPSSPSSSPFSSPAPSPSLSTTSLSPAVREDVEAPQSPLTPTHGIPEPSPLFECPICSNLLRRSDIEDHAASCMHRPLPVDMTCPPELSPTAAARFVAARALGGSNGVLMASRIASPPTGPRTFRPLVEFRCPPCMSNDHEWWRCTVRQIKTRMCVHQKKGRCEMGARCNFAHGAHEVGCRPCKVFGDHSECVCAEATSKCANCNQHNHAASNWDVCSHASPSYMKQIVRLGRSAGGYAIWVKGSPGGVSSRSLTPPTTMRVMPGGPHLPPGHRGPYPLTPSPVARVLRSRDGRMHSAGPSSRVMPLRDTSSHPSGSPMQSLFSLGAPFSALPARSISTDDLLDYEAKESPFAESVDAAPADLHHASILEQQTRLRQLQRAQQDVHLHAPRSARSDEADAMVDSVRISLLSLADSTAATPKESPHPQASPLTSQTS